MRAFVGSLDNQLTSKDSKKLPSNEFKVDVVRNIEPEYVLVCYIFLRGYIQKFAQSVQVCLDSIESTIFNRF